MLLLHPEGHDIKFFHFNDFLNHLQVMSKNLWSE